jgi:hypothetical protein
MTVATTLVFSEYTADGSTTAFGLAAYCQTADQVEVLIDDVVQSDATYTVSGLRSPTGVTATFSTAPTSGTVRVRRVLPLTQGVDTQNNEVTYQEVFDDALDRQVMVDQQLDETLGRTLRVAAATAELGSSFHNKLLGFGDNGAPIAVSGGLTVSNSTVLCESRAAATLIDFDGAPFLIAAGYWEAGDCPPLSFVQVDAEPDHGFQDAGGNWYAQATEEINVLHHGAKGDGVTPAFAAFTSAFDFAVARGGGTVTVPFGAYNLEDNPLEIPPGVSLVGQDGAWPTFLFDGVDVAVSTTGATEGKRRIANFYIGGNGTTAFACFDNVQANLGGLQNIIENIALVPESEWVDGFKFANLYASGVVRNLSTQGADVSNALFSFLRDVNAVSFDGLYTGGSNNHKYCFFIDSDTSIGGTVSAGHGLQLNSPVAQGGRFGFFIKSARGLVVNNPYTENVACPVVLGIDDTGSITVRGVVWNGGTLGGVNININNPYYALRGPVVQLSNCRGVLFNAPEFFAPDQVATVAVVFTGGGFTTAARAFARINRDGTVHSVVIVDPGAGYSSDPTASIGGSATFTVVRTADKVTSLTITDAGNTDEYDCDDKFPFGIVYGHGVSGVRFTRSYHAFNTNTSMFALVGRSTLATGGVEIDDEWVTGAGNIVSASLRKAEGGALHELEYLTTAAGTHAFLSVTPAQIDVTDLAP